MNFVAAVAQQADEALFTVARSSQALVIASLDRAVSIRDSRSSVIPGFIKRPLEATMLLARDPARYVDDGYDRLERLLQLHREFTQRLFEVVDPGDEGLTAKEQRPSAARVTHMADRRARSAG
jgi:hypothetical protein